MNTVVWVSLYVLGIFVSYFVFRVIYRKIQAHSQFGVPMAFVWPVAVVALIVSLAFLFAFEAIDRLVEKVSP